MTVDVGPVLAKAGRQLSPRAEPELRVDVGEMELDRLDAHEQLRRDGTIAQTVADQPGDRQFLRREAVRVERASFRRRQTTRDQLALASLLVRLRLEGGEPVSGGLKLDRRRAPLPVAAERLAVGQLDQCSVERQR